MPQFHELARPILKAISDLSGDSYRDIEGMELVDELDARGHAIEPVTLYNLMFRLREAGFVDFTPVGGMDPAAFGLIHLEGPGRQEVEGWPSPAGISRPDVEALIHAFEAVGDDPGLPESERSKARGMARDLSVEVAGGVIANWLRLIGLG